MRYQVLATDYDGTLASDGRVSASTVESLEKLLGTGRRLVLVTGRELPELLEIFPRIELFERVVAENGALLYRPSTKESIELTQAPDEKFVAALRQRGVDQISVGKSIVATWEPYQQAVLETIRDQGLELQVIFNKGAVMILPAGVNKATGLTVALREMSLSPHNAVGVGDAENDHAFLRLCELSAAVSNALPSVKETCDFTTQRDHGGGVEELIGRLIENDLADFEEKIKRHDLMLGERDGEEVHLASYGRSALICGPSGSGKSTVVTRLVESIVERQYQFCLIDPEGDYESFEGAMVLGGPDRPPVAEEIIQLLSNPEASAVVNLTGLPIPERPPFFLKLLAMLLQMRSRTGRPHWLILDEAHHLMPADWQPPDGLLPEKLRNMILITVHADLLSPKLMERINTLMVVGPQADATIGSFCAATKMDPPEIQDVDLQTGELLLWSRDAYAGPLQITVHPCKTERRRHRRKYAEGELPPDRSFYFTGAKKKLNLRAQNLKMFLQLADGVDDETWEHHRKRGDYSLWFRDCIKDENLAAEAERIEGLRGVGAAEGRKILRGAIERDYIVLASPPMPVPGAS